MTHPQENDEQEILNSYDQGEWQSVKTVREDLRQYQAYVAATLEQSGQVSIALSDETCKAFSARHAKPVCPIKN